MSPWTMCIYVYNYEYLYGWDHKNWNRKTYTKCTIRVSYRKEIVPRKDLKETSNLSVIMFCFLKKRSYAKINVYYLRMVDAQVSL